MGRVGRDRDAERDSERQGKRGREAEGGQGGIEAEQSKARRRQKQRQRPRRRGRLGRKQKREGRGRRFSGEPAPATPQPPSPHGTGDGVLGEGLHVDEVVVGTVLLEPLADVLLTPQDHGPRQATQGGTCVVQAIVVRVQPALWEEGWQVEWGGKEGRG